MSAERGESTIEARAREFVRENESLLGSAGSSTLARIFTQGTEISTSLSGELVQAANQLTQANKDLAAAIRDPKTPPKRIHALEVRRPTLIREWERKNGAFKALSTFLDRVQALYSERAPVERQE